MQAARQRLFPTLFAASGAGALLLHNQQFAPFTAQADAPAPAARTGALDPANFLAFKVMEKEQLTHNTYRLKFELPSGKEAGLKTASCLVTRAMVPGESKPVIRPYTPTSPADAVGYLELVVKSYEAGKMSKHICNLQVGDTLDMKGPIPKLPYKANMVKRIGMVCGGTGITPMLQVIDAVVADPADSTEVHLIYANMTENDIILKSKIDKIVKDHKNIKVTYVVDKVNKPGWFGNPYTVGRVSRALLDKTMPVASDDCLLLICGPPGMMEAVSGKKAPDFTQGEVSGLFKDMGFSSAQVFKF